MIYNLISFFAGFLASSIIDTTLGEFSEWAIVGAFVAANIESFNNFYYSAISKTGENCKTIYIYVFKRKKI